MAMVTPIPRSSIVHVGVFSVLSSTSPWQFGKKQRGSRVRVHWPLKTLRWGRRDSLIAARLASLAPIEQTIHFTNALYLNRVATSFASLTIAAVDSETLIVARRSRTLVIGKICAQQSRRCVNHDPCVVLTDRSNRGKRAQPDSPEHLTPIHIANAARNVLIEQNLCNRHRRINVIENTIDALLEICVDMAQVWAKTTESGVAVTIELAKRLDQRSVEAHRNPIGDLYRNSQLAGRLVPPFADSVQPPRTRQPLMRMQSETVVPHNLEMLALTTNSLNCATHRRFWANQTRRGEADRWLAHQRGSQRRSGAMGSVPL